MVPHSSLTLTMFGRDKALLRSILVGGVWNGFLLQKVNDGHLFWERPFPPLVEIREHPEFHDLVEMDKTSWLGVCFGMVGCLFFLGSMGVLLGLRALGRVLLGGTLLTR